MKLDRAATARIGPWLVALAIIVGIITVYVSHSVAWGALIVFGSMAIGAFATTGSVGAAAIFGVPAAIALVALFIS